MLLWQTGNCRGTSFPKAFIFCIWCGTFPFFETNQASPPMTAGNQTGLCILNYSFLYAILHCINQNVYHGVYIPIFHGSIGPMLAQYHHLSSHNMIFVSFIINQWDPHLNTKYLTDVLNKSKCVPGLRNVDSLHQPLLCCIHVKQCKLPVQTSGCVSLLCATQHSCKTVSSSLLSSAKHLPTVDNNVSTGVDHHEQVREGGQDFTPVIYWLLLIINDY